MLRTMNKCQLIFDTLFNNEQFQTEKDSEKLSPAFSSLGGYLSKIEQKEGVIQKE